MRIAEGTVVRAWNGDECADGFYSHKSGSWHFVVLLGERGTKYKAFDRVRELVTCELPEGVKIGDRVEVWDDDQVAPNRETTLVALTCDGRFVCNEFHIWDHCRPIKKTVLRKKKASEIVKLLEDEGYSFNAGSFCCEKTTAFRRCIVGTSYALNYVLSKCGEIVDEGEYPPDWTEEEEAPQ